MREAECTVCDTTAISGSSAIRRSSAISVLSASSSGCPVRKRSVQDNGALSLDIGHRDHTLVEALIAAVAQDILLVPSVLVVVAAAFVVLLAKALDRLRLVGIDGDVIEGPAVLIRVRVDAVTVPPAEETIGEYSGSNTNSNTEEDWGNSTPGRAPSSVWDRTAAAVVCAATVGWFRS